jgi:Phosphotransferase enzyme family
VPYRAASIAESYADWAGPRQPEEDIFGTGDPERIAALVDRFCARSLGSGVERYEFFASSVLSVHGVRLLDGRRVVVKAARPSFGSAFLESAQTVQSHLASSGFPCPKPILGPRELERGIAVVEELLDRGGRADAHDPAIRREMAATLARQVDLARPFVSLNGLRPSLLASPVVGELWPEPHDARFDFRASGGGAEWIDKLAAAARRRLAENTGETVLAHADWRAEHVRFDGGAIVASYDWQSLAVGSEAALIGQIGYGFTTDWSIEQQRRMPTLEEFRAFITDYAAARGKQFSRTERQTVDAAWVYATAYGARCEHSDLMLGMPWGGEATDDSYRGLLARHAAELLSDFES